MQEDPKSTWKLEFLAVNYKKTPEHREIMECYHLSLPRCMFRGLIWRPEKSGTQREDTITRLNYFLPIEECEETWIHYQRPDHDNRKANDYTVNTITDDTLEAKCFSFFSPCGILIDKTVPCGTKAPDVPAPLFQQSAVKRNLLSIVKLVTIRTIMMTTLNLLAFQNRISFVLGPHCRCSMSAIYLIIRSVFGLAQFLAVFLMPHQIRDSKVSRFVIQILRLSCRL